MGVTGVRTNNIIRPPFNICSYGRFVERDSVKLITSEVNLGVVESWSANVLTYYFAILSHTSHATMVNIFCFFGETSTLLWKVCSNIDEIHWTNRHFNECIPLVFKMAFEWEDFRNNRWFQQRLFYHKKASNAYFSNFNHQSCFITATYM